MTKILLLALSFALLPLAAQENEKERSPAEQLLKIMKFEQTVMEGGEVGFTMIAQSLAEQVLDKEEMAQVKDAFMPFQNALTKIIARKAAREKKTPSNANDTIATSRGRHRVPRQQPVTLRPS
ncbi:MAG: hypothetical protein ACJAVK_002352 [Akkermansiaceae bacterium]|jgi:hypothetical protein